LFHEMNNTKTSNTIESIPFQISDEASFCCCMVARCE